MFSLLSSGRFLFFLLFYFSLKKTVIFKKSKIIRIKKGKKEILQAAYPIIEKLKTSSIWLRDRERARVVVSDFRGHRMHARIEENIKRKTKGTRKDLRVHARRKRSLNKWTRKAQLLLLNNIQVYNCNNYDLMFIFFAYIFRFWNLELVWNIELLRPHEFYFRLHPYSYSFLRV